MQRYNFFDTKARLIFLFFLKISVNRHIVANTNKQFAIINIVEIVALLSVLIAIILYIKVHN